MTGAGTWRRDPPLLRRCAREAHDSRLTGDSSSSHGEREVGWAEEVILESDVDQPVCVDEIYMVQHTYSSRSRAGCRSALWDNSYCGFHRRGRWASAREGDPRGLVSAPSCRFRTAKEFRIGESASSGCHCALSAPACCLQHLRGHFKVRLGPSCEGRAFHARVLVLT